MFGIKHELLDPLTTHARRRCDALAVMAGSPVFGIKLELLCPLTTTMMTTLLLLLLLLPLLLLPLLQPAAELPPPLGLCSALGADSMTHFPPPPPPPPPLHVPPHLMSRRQHYNAACRSARRGSFFQKELALPPVVRAPQARALRGVRIIIVVVVAIAVVMAMVMVVVVVVA